MEGAAPLAGPAGRCIPEQAISRINQRWVNSQPVNYVRAVVDEPPAELTSSGLILSPLVMSGL